MEKPLLFLSIFFIGFGLMVWRFRLAGLLSAYDPKKIRDKEGFAKWGGSNLMLLGVLLLLINILVEQLPVLKEWVGKLILLVSIGVLFWMYRGFEKFEVKESPKSQPGIKAGNSGRNKNREFRKRIKAENAGTKIK
ncbi:DUF3784 domain-containing protein [Methanosarcina sp. KYL-1]|uniref:DUF3784 domain-containing protein n=1 Tax=Methanosarcina sp. KYL-1 TaxID=2602068 RepID=UPI0021015912|nr:DUF3784 domain-containing protein [Methanosarcina sp. KYL-1]